MLVRIQIYIIVTRQTSINVLPRRAIRCPERRLRGKRLLHAFEIYIITKIVTIGGGGNLNLSVEHSYHVLYN